MDRINSYYQKIFHPTEGMENARKRDKAKNVLKSIGLFATIVMPIVVGSVKKYREYKATHQPPNGDNSTANIVKRSAAILNTSSKNSASLEEDHPTVERDTLPTVAPAKNEPLQPMTFETFDPAVVVTEWKKMRADTEKKANEGNPHAKFQLLLWEKEGRNVKETTAEELIEIVKLAVEAGNPEAILWKITELYNSKQKVDDTRAIEKEIRQLRETLEKDPTPQGVAAKAKLWAMRREEGDGGKLKDAAKDGIPEAMYRQAIYTENRRIDLDGLEDAAEKGHPEAQLKLGLELENEVFILTPGEDEEPVSAEDLSRECYAQAAQLGNIEAFGRLCKAKLKGKDANDPESIKWTRALVDVFGEEKAKNFH